jgi:GTP pyrophosphokinase
MAVVETNTLELEKKEILKQYRNLLRAFKPSLSKSDKKQLRAAFEMALDSHRDMRRKSGEPYIMHPIMVAQIVVKEMGLAVGSAICALLHDVVEDTELTLDDIRGEFGSRIALIIDGLTKISEIVDFSSSIQAENFKKLLLTLAQDVRVILIKIADRLHNMRTLDSMSNKKQLKIASETLYLYAPLAHRLGFYAIKSELEDLGMKYTEVEAYRDIAQKLTDTKRERTRYINEFCKPLQAQLNEAGLEARVFGRPKAIYSIWNKMKNKGVTFEEVFDLFAIRVILTTEKAKEKEDCWKAYSMVTDLYRPNPDRLRDWISNAKVNGYESLHTTVMGPKGKWVEVQIRSEKMDEIAEKGFAAHWKYKQSSQDSSLDIWLAEIREQLQNPDSNALDFLDDFRSNLFAREIYLFTPKGDLKILPLGATALDFAFEIHTDIGLRCIGAKVNHKLVPLSHKLKNGDQVEVITSRKQRPSDGWLIFLKSSRARSKTKYALKEEKRKIAADGRELLQRKFKQNKINYEDKNINLLLSHFKKANSLELLYSIGSKKLDLSNFKFFDIKGGRLYLPKPKDEKVVLPSPKTKKLAATAPDLLIFDDIADNIDYKFGKCCNPIVGDEVFGFITVGSGITIHRTNCPNSIQLASKYGYRIVKTRWTHQSEITFLTGLKIVGLDDVGLMSKITNVISTELKLNMQSINVDAKDGVFEGRMKVYVRDTDQINRLIKRLTQIKGVDKVLRLEE